MAVVTQALEKRRERAAERVKVAEVAAPQSDQAVTAAAASIPLDGSGWKTFKLGSDKWQKDAWHQYDINGDLRFLANWVGKACSRARLYLAKVDENGRPGEEVTDPKLQIIAETLFGSPAAKAEAQRLMGVHLFVPGESFIVAEAANNANEDRWYVVSTSDVRRQGEKQVEVQRPQQYGGGWYQLKAGTDLLIRVWTPHPNKYDAADSSVRAGLIPLREIEQLTKFGFAEVDSRLAGAGLLFVPQEMDFPRPDNQKANAASLSAQLTKTMSTALANREDASSLVPIIISVPGELIGKVQHLQFSGPLADKLDERMEAAVNRLARALETEPEILTGKADMNHWSAWQVDESTIGMHVSPLLSRMCDALTAGYIRAALSILGEDPDAYVLWYDTAPLTVEPDRQKDALEMHDKVLISDDAARKAGSWGDGDAPDDEERERRLAEKFATADPTLLREPDVLKALDLPWKLTAPADPMAIADKQTELQEKALEAKPKPEAPAVGAAPEDNVRQMPDRRETRQAAALRVGAHMAVLRALELSGKRLLTRANRDRFPGVPAHELHTKIKVVDIGQAEQLIASADGPAVDLSVLAEETDLPQDALATLLAAYCTELMRLGARHDMDLLGAYMAAGLHADCPPDECYAPEHQGRCGDEARRFHLPGRHNQKTHGHRVGKPRVPGDVPGTGPFTPPELRKRKAMRDGRWSGDGKKMDPDKNAPAPDRQGKRAFSEWSQHARYLTGEWERETEQMFRKELAESPPPKEQSAREAEWAKIEKKMRDDLADRIKKFDKRIADLEASGEKQDKFELTIADYQDMRGSFPDIVEQQIETRRNEFLSKSPEKIEGRVTARWYNELPAGVDTEKPVPMIDVQDVPYGYTMKRGYAVRRGALAFAIETKGHSDAEQKQAQELADKLAAAHKGLLPSDADQRQYAYTWALGNNPGDAYWQDRFGSKSHRAHASAGNGEITYWGRGRKDSTGFFVSPIDEAVLAHEYAHNRDVSDDGKNHGISDGPKWRGAALSDGAKWTTASGRPKRADVPLRDFSPTPGTRGEWPVTLHKQERKGNTLREQPFGVTDYGKSSNQEDFAESLKLYWGAKPVGNANFRREDGTFMEAAAPVFFRDLFPARAAVLDELYPEEAERQKEKLGVLRAGPGWKKKPKSAGS